MSKVIKVSATCLIGLSVLAAAGYFLIIGGGKPIGTDLSIIGKGKPVLVLAYENFSPIGGTALNSLRQVSRDYQPRIEFVVADLGTPQGEAFAERYQLYDGLAVILNKDGQAPQTIGVPIEEGELRFILESKLANTE